MPTIQQLIDDGEIKRPEVENLLEALLGGTTERRFKFKNGRVVDLNPLFEEGSETARVLADRTLTRRTPIVRTALDRLEA